MSIKILGGLVKGQSLFVPKDQTIRPTSVMLRRKIFDANQNLNEWNFIDCCAGTGAIGIEALSRGAASLISIEKNSKVIPYLERNIQTTTERLDSMKVSAPIKLIKCDSLIWLKKFSEIYKLWSEKDKLQTIIFLDPPYGDKQLYKNFIGLLYDDSFWFHGRFWLESDNQKGITDTESRQLLEDKGELKLFKHSQSYILCVKSHLYK